MSLGNKSPWLHVSSPTSVTFNDLSTSTRVCKMSQLQLLLADLSDHAVGHFLGLTALAAIAWATKLVYQYMTTEGESPVHYQVQTPPELSPRWHAKNWDDVDERDKRILRSQSIGVSFLCLLNFSQGSSRPS